MLNLCEKVTKIFRSRSTATVRTDFVSFSHRFSILDIRSRFQSPFLGLMLILLFSNVAHAHKPSDSYLTVDIQDARIEGQWDIAVRDLDYAIGLDENDDGEISWRELRGHHVDVAAYAFARLKFYSDGASCPVRIKQHLVDNHSDGAYAVVRFMADCATESHVLTIDYNLFFDIDPQHRGLMRLNYHNEGALVTQSAIFSPERANQKFNLNNADILRQFLDYATMGIWHISIGFDHILFLLALLLPSVLHREGGRWQAVTHFRAALWDILKIVTAFTLAHSITLSLATLQVIALPTRWVESAIAVSIVLAALNNIYPLFKQRRWIVACIFGLIHGMGFAGALLDLGLTENSLWLALVAFNVGVEAGQMAIVIVFVPLAYWLRHSVFYHRGMLGIGSLLIAVLGFVWLVERSFDMKLLVYGT